MMIESLSNIQAEQDVIGDLLSCPNDLHRISGIIRASDFYGQANRFIYETLAGMILAGKTPDFVLLIESLKAAGDLEKIGGISTVTNLASNGRCYNLAEQAEIIAGYARRRRLVDKAKELEQVAADTSQDVGSSIARICDDLLEDSRPVGENAVCMQDACMDFLRTLERRKSGGMLKTGIHSLDAMIVGLEPGQLIILGGRPGNGKTALAGTLALNAANEGKRVLYFSLEMVRAELAGRFISRIGGIKGDKLKRPDNTTLHKINKAVRLLKSMPMMIDDRTNLTPADVSATARRVQSTNGLDLVIIDHIGLMHSGRKQDSSRYAEISFASRQLKILAKTLDIPVVALSQLSRDHDRAGRPPRLSDLRDSGSLEQDADTVILIYRPENLNDSANPFVDGVPTTAIIAKQRNGRTGQVPLNFNASHGYFEDAELVPMSERQERRIKQVLE